MYHVKITPVSGVESTLLPHKMSEGASGFDLCAAVKNVVDLIPMAVELIPTGIKISMPQNLEAQVRPRSGLALKHGITVLNSPGTIDSDYRGEICVILMNMGQKSFHIHHGDRIAQLVFQEIPSVRFQLTTELDETPRGTDGFGSTGK